MAKILLVNDDPQFREDWVPRLVRRGHTVVYALNGDQGLRLALAGKPDLIITDLVMPVVDGYDMVLALRAAGLTMPIIMFCGPLVESNRQMVLDAGVAEVVLKGEAPDVLLAAIDRQLAENASLALSTRGAQ